MKKREEEEIRWQVVKAILEVFPEVREKVKDYRKALQIEGFSLEAWILSLVLP